MEETYKCGWNIGIEGLPKLMSRDTLNRRCKKFRQEEMPDTR
jgi:hypothetical protein